VLASGLFDAKRYSRSGYVVIVKEREVGEVERQPKLPAGAGVQVRISHVAKRFGSHPVLADVNLDIRPGEFVAIVGHSGCGKSTLLRLISGLDFPNGGSIEVDGQPVTRQLPESRMMFQDARLLPWRRVLENVGIGRRGGWKSAAIEALDQVGLADRAGDWPAVLSGGQRQRVALARALVSRPKLLLLDEPLGALDALTRLDMQRLVEQVWTQQKFTAVLVTHDVSEAVALADWVVVLERGVVPLVQRIEQRRPRVRGDSSLGEIEGEILARLLEGNR
jgi:sulfonate transport system ATP-binding protein